MLKTTHSKGFSLVEMLVVISIIAILSVTAVFGIQGMQRYLTNAKVQNDLIAIANALDQFRQDNGGDLPRPAVPEKTGNYNVLCFKADSSYSHDCSGADFAFMQTQVDNALLSKKYLPEVPLDPRSGSRYAYGVDKNKDYYMIAGVIEKTDGVFEALAIDNLQRGSPLPSLIRSYDGPQFVAHGTSYLPYSPTPLALTAKLQNVVGTVTIINNVIDTGPGEEADVYFSDGSVSHLDENSHLILEDLQVTKNSATEIGTTVKLKLTAGKLWSKVIRLSQGSEFNVKTTNAVAGVRGTEFGVSVTGDTAVVAVKSGEVDVKDLDSSTEVQVLSGQAATVGSDGTPVAVPAEQTGSYFGAFDSLQTNTLNDNVIPYILGVASDGSGVILDIGFGGTRAENYAGISFEVYTGDQFAEPRVLKEDIHVSPASASYTTPVYKLSVPANQSSLAEASGLVVRAVQGKDVSNFSWPPVGFKSTNTPTLSFVELYPELRADTVIASDTTLTQCPAVTNGENSGTLPNCNLTCNSGFYNLNGSCVEAVCTSGATQSVTEAIMLGSDQVGTKTGTITCLASGGILAWSTPANWTVSCSAGYYGTGTTCAQKTIALSTALTSGSAIENTSVTFVLTPETQYQVFKNGALDSTSSNATFTLASGSYEFRVADVTTPAANQKVTVTALKTAQAACYGSDLVATGTNNGYWDSSASACWVLGQAGDGCDDPDGTGPYTGACNVLDGKVVTGYDASCVVGNWNDDQDANTDGTWDICKTLSPTSSGSGNATNNFAPYLGSQCTKRNTSVTLNQICNVQSILFPATQYETLVQRICKCN